MGRRVDLLQCADGDVGIDLRGLQLHMAEDFLNEPDVGPVLVHQRSHRVPEQVTGPGLAQLRRADDLFKADKRRLHQGPRVTTLNFEAGYMQSFLIARAEKSMQQGPGPYMTPRIRPIGITIWTTGRGYAPTGISLNCRQSAS